MARRDEVLDAAIKLLAERGSRGLNHRAVDAAADVPEGTTSNHFRSRNDLILGICDRFTAHTTELAGSENPPDIIDREQFRKLLASRAHAVLDSHAHGMRAFQILLLESAANPALADKLAPIVEGHIAELATQLAHLGATRPDDAARTLVGYQTVVLGIQIQAPQPNFDPDKWLEPIINGLLPARLAPAHRPS